MSTETDKDTAARERIADVTVQVMQKAAESLNAMVNHLVTQVREDEKFLGAILVPGVNLELDVQVPDDLEQKVMVLVADCVAKDRVETLTLAVNPDGEPPDCEAIEAMLEEAKEEAAEIAKVADEVRAAPAAEAPKDAPKGPGIVLPEGLVRCPGCGGAATPLSKCARCGKDVGIKL